MSITIFPLTDHHISLFKKYIFIKVPHSFMLDPVTFKSKMKCDLQSALFIPDFLWILKAVVWMLLKKPHLNTSTHLICQSLRCELHTDGVNSLNAELRNSMQPSSLTQNMRNFPHIKIAVTFGP